MKKKTQTKTSLPDSKTLRHFREKLSDLNYKGGNLALPEDATEVEKMKYDLCQLIAKYRREKNLIQRDLAKILGINESRISDILRGKIEGFTVERLMGYAETLYPNLKIRIIAA